MLMVMTDKNLNRLAIIQRVRALLGQREAVRFRGLTFSQVQRVLRHGVALERRGRHGNNRILDDLKRCSRFS